MKKIMQFLILAAFLVGLVGVAVPVQAQVMPVYGDPESIPHVHPFMTIGANVMVKGVPVPPGTLVEFFCQGRLAGSGWTYDFDEGNRGVLGYTPVYGTDIYSVPVTPKCESNDLISIYIDGNRAVYSPQIRWQGNFSDQVIELNLDLEARIFFEDQNLAAFGVLPVPSTLRTRQFSLPGSMDEIAEELPDYQEPLAEGSVSSYSLTDGQNRTYLFASHDVMACLWGPTVFLSRGGGETIVRLVNYTGLPMQTILTLEETSGPSGIMTGMASSFEIQTDALWGSVETRVGNESGATCSKLVWDFRPVPAPRIVWGAAFEDRLLNLSGDNLIFPSGMEFDPRLVVTLTSEDGVQKWQFNYCQVMGTEPGCNQVDTKKSFWDARDIKFVVPDSVPGGNYLVTVWVAGMSSNSELISLPEVVAPPPPPVSVFFTFLSFIGK